MHLGRGAGGGDGSKIVIEGHRVIKTAVMWEPRYMQRFPEAFVPVTWVDTQRNGPLTRYAMPLMAQPSLADFAEGLSRGLRLLRDYVWWREDGTLQPHWRADLYQHLIRQIYLHKLYVDPYDSLERVITRLPEVYAPVCIHGDATYANMVRRPSDGAWLWLDPLRRPFIPGDPHVDLGKAFQSCWGYEDVLLNLDDAPLFREPLARQLAQETGLDYDRGLDWCYIHLVRLLPYQDARVRGIYETVLQNWSVR